jgi:hypothetical protein
MPRVHVKGKEMPEFHLVYLGVNEWGEDKMRSIAASYFEQTPGCHYVKVSTRNRNQALGLRRDGTQWYPPQPGKLETMQCVAVLHRS